MTEPRRGNEPVRVGLVGAGPWAARVHAPAIAAHAGTTLAGVWARRPDAAAALIDDVAAPDRPRVYASTDELIADVDAVAFAVPPAVQFPIALAAARAGRHVILEKPIAPTADEARQLADAVTDAGVASIVVLVLRFAPEVREWLASIAALDVRAATTLWVAGSLLGGPSANSPWRHESGALADVGPHAVDLVDAAVGEVTGVLACHRSEPDVWQLVLAHANGATSTMTLTMTLPVDPTITSVAVYGDGGASTCPPRTTPAIDSYAVLLDEFVAMVREGRTTHDVDARRGSHLQRVLDQARSLAQG